MNNKLLTLLSVAVIVTLIGCGKSNELLRAKGQVVKNGEDFIPDDDQSLQVCFIPMADDGTLPRNWYAAEVDQATGSFYAAGAEKKGMPSGKYRVMVELKKNRKDLFAGKFDSLKSPFVFDIDETSPPMVLDLENPPKN